eukprot:jgi/Botrbrau1/5507/Bobra.27_1s0044.1
MVQYRPEVAGGTCRLKPGEVRALFARALEGVPRAFFLQEAYPWVAVVARRKGAKFGEHRGRDGILHAQGQTCVSNAVTRLLVMGVAQEQGNLGNSTIARLSISGAHRPRSL